MMTSLCSPELLVRQPPVLQGSYYTGPIDPSTVSVQVIQMSSGQNQKKKKKKENFSQMRESLCTFETQCLNVV